MAHARGRDFVLSLAESPLIPRFFERILGRIANFVGVFPREDRCRRAGSQLTFEANATPATFILRLRHIAAPSAVAADGQPLRRLERQALADADRGWTLEDRTVVVKARARRIEVR